MSFQGASSLGLASYCGGGGEVGFRIFGVDEAGGGSKMAVSLESSVPVCTHFNIWTEPVHHLIFPYHQHVFFLSNDAVVVLIEMEDVGREVGGFSTNVEEGFLYILMN